MNLKQNASPWGHRVALAAAAVSALALAGCASPYYDDRPVTQAPAPVYTYPSQPVPVEGYRRRGNEALYEAQVMSVRAVLGEPQQRCWIEREEIVQPRQNNIPGAVAGAVIGGILGHQIGGGSGRDIARIGGAVAGAAIGSNMGTDRYGAPVATTQDVQRCSSVPGSATPAYWDVTYEFQGVTHRAQMTEPPGRTITVNSRGEPRI